MVVYPVNHGLQCVDQSYNARLMRYLWYLNSVVAAVRMVESGGVWCNVFWALLNYALCFSYYANKAGRTCEYFVV